MTLLAFLGVCGAGCFVSAITAPWRLAGRIAGMLSIAAALAAALLIRPGDAATVGDVRLDPTWFGSLFVSAALAACLLAAAIGSITELPRGFAAVALAAVGLLGLALSSTQSGVALIAVAAATAPAVALAVQGAPRSLAASELRTLALIAAAALLAAACGLGAAWTGDVAAAVPAAAYLLLAAGVAVRSGSVPFHVPAARLARATNPLVLPLLLILLPAGLGTVALGWAQGISARDGSDMPATLVLVVGVATICLGAVAALLHGDIAEIAAYSIVGDSGFVLLALGTHGSSAADPARLWLLCFVTGKTALAVWVAAASAGFHTRRLEELSGWARRMPVLGAALAVAGVATIGWPGLAVFEARTDLVEAALSGPFTAIAGLSVALSMLVYGRLLVRGALPPGATVTAAISERPRRRAASRRSRPQAKPVANATAAPRFSAAVGAIATARASLHAGVEAGRANLVPARSAIVLATALVAAGLAAGGFGASGAASSDWALVVNATAAPTLSPDQAPQPSESQPASGDENAPPEPTGSTQDAQPSAAEPASASPAPASPAPASPAPASPASGSLLPASAPPMSPAPSASAGS